MHGSPVGARLGLVPRSSAGRWYRSAASNDEVVSSARSAIVRGSLVGKNSWQRRRRVRGPHRCWGCDKRRLVRTRRAPARLRGPVRLVRVPGLVLVWQLARQDHRSRRANRPVIPLRAPGLARFGRVDRGGPITAGPGSLQAIPSHPSRRSALEGFLVTEWSICAVGSDVFRPKVTDSATEVARGRPPTRGPRRPP